MFIITATNDFINIYKMLDEVIVTTDNRYLTILEIDPINFSYKSVDEKRKIIRAFAAYSKILPVRFRIKVTSRRANVDHYIANLQKEFQNEADNKYIGEYQKEYVNLVRNLGNREGIERHF